MSIRIPESSAPPVYQSGQATSTFWDLPGGEDMPATIARQGGAYAVATRFRQQGYLVVRPRSGTMPPRPGWRVFEVMKGGIQEITRDL
jgi:hypothetical protein